MSEAPIEAHALLLSAILGAAQYAVRGGLGDQVRRNFAETFPVFAGGIALLWIADGLGDYSGKGAALYLAGRVLYLLLSAAPVRSFRKFAWALSVAGLIGVGAQAIMLLLGTS